LPFLFDIGIGRLHRRAIIAVFFRLGLPFNFGLLFGLDALENFKRLLFACLYLLGFLELRSEVSHARGYDLRRWLAIALGFGGVEVARQVEDEAVGLAALPLKLAQRLGAGQSLQGFPFLPDALVAWLAGPAFVPAGRWPEVMGRFAVDALRLKAAVIDAGRYAVFA
jgi:hypothetical protein